MQELVESTWRWRDAGTPMRRRRRIVSGEIMEFLDFSPVSPRPRKTLKGVALRACLSKQFQRVDGKGCKRGKSVGTAGDQACRILALTYWSSGSMRAWPATLHRLPRYSQTAMPSLSQVLARLRKASRQSRPISLRVPALTLRRGGEEGGLFSPPVGGGGVLGGGHTNTKTPFFGCKRRPPGGQRRKSGGR